MSQLDSGLSKEDLETLIEAMNDWEAIGNQEYHVLNMVKSAPIPPEDHESHEFVVKIKDHFKEREKEIKATREVRQERAILLKAKLTLIKRDIGIDQLFENAIQPLPRTPTKEEQDGLKLAEEFIRDLGVWGHYEKFLTEKVKK